MKKFAVAFFNSFNGELKLEIIEAPDELNAGLAILSPIDREEIEIFQFDTLEELANTIGEDYWLQVKEILSL